MTAPDPAAVRTMFGRIAHRYDVANRLLSLGLDRSWRRRLVREVAALAPASVLDVTTGSGDVAFALAETLPGDTSVVAIDFCEPMLMEAEKKRLRQGPGSYPRLRFGVGDALQLAFPDASFDALTISFGLRNLPDRGRFFGEARRVLRPGGALFVLEFSQPAGWFRPLYLVHLRWVLPVLGGALSGDREAYRYLDRTIEGFPDAGCLAEEMRAAGYGSVTVRRLTAGAVALHEARR